MLLAALLIHFFLPHESNNYRARFLHPVVIGFSVFAFVLSQMALSFVPNITPAVLGYASSISVEEIVELSNKRREENGVQPLTLSSVLSQAAMAKASDMFAKDYWAHVAPDGTQPWAFFVGSGYQYRYAGENLARDFYDSKSVVDAWMDSPTHRENLLASRYEDIGVAVVNGELDGVKTTLVVQFFGTEFAALSGLAETEGISGASEVPTTVPAESLGGLVAGTGFKPSDLIAGIKNDQKSFLLSPFSSTKRVAIFLVSLFVMILSIDMVLIKHKRVVRRSSRSFAHFVFFGVILVVLFVAQAGVIL